jgi:hypothetical protein
MKKTQIATARSTAYAGIVFTGAPYARLLP